MSATSRLPGKNRVESLVDGIFSVSMTLLVLDIKLPPGLAFSTNQDRLLHFASVEFSFAIYVVSVCILAMFWIAHHFQFTYVERVDRTLLWINLLFLLFTTLAPFSTNLVASHGTLQVPVLLYGGNLLMLYLMLALHLRRMRHQRNLTNAEFLPEIGAAMSRRLRSFCVLPVVAMLVALYSPPWGIRVFYLLAFLHFVPDMLDHIPGAALPKEDSERAEDRQRTPECGPCRLSASRRRRLILGEVPRRQGKRVAAKGIAEFARDHHLEDRRLALFLGVASRAQRCADIAGLVDRVTFGTHCLGHRCP